MWQMSAPPQLKQRSMLLAYTTKRVLMDMFHYFVAKWHLTLLWTVRKHEAAGPLHSSVLGSRAGEAASFQPCRHCGELEYPGMIPQTALVERQTSRIPYPLSLHNSLIADVPAY